MIAQINIAFEIGTKVKYASKIGKDEGYITGFSIRGKSPNYRICYGVTWSDKIEKWHDDFELELDK